MPPQAERVTASALHATVLAEQETHTATDGATATCVSWSASAKDPLFAVPLSPTPPCDPQPRIEDLRIIPCYWLGRRVNVTMGFYAKRSNVLAYFPSKSKIRGS